MQPKDFYKFLIINPYGIGDLLFCTPLMRGIKKCYPKSEVSFVVGQRTHEVLKNHPFINFIYPYQKELFKKQPFLKKLKYLYQFHCEIRNKQYDVVFDLSLTDEFSFYSKFLWNIPLRIGFSFKKRGRFLNRKEILSEGFKKNAVADYYKNLLKFIDKCPIDVERKLDFYIPKRVFISTKAIFSKYKISQNKKKICIVPGGGGSWGKEAYHKFWPVEYYSMLCDELTKRYSAEIFILGDASEKKSCQQVSSKNKFKVFNLSGKTTLHQAAAIIKKSHLVIGNDSGLMHIAVAVGTPSISIYGPINEKVYGPYTDHKIKHLVVYTDLQCRPCYDRFRMPECKNDHQCLKQIHPNQVLDLAHKLLMLEKM